MRKILLVGMLAMSVVMYMAGSALAFHDGGVAYCGGCHTMHNSQNGVPVDTLHPNGNLYLLKNATASDVCLGCHGNSTSRGVFGTNPLSPLPLHGGGDFIFLTEDNINDGHSGATNPIPGYKSGHSIVAPSKGLVADPTLTHSPGGSFPSSLLGCSSCHDPHGNENFRLLNGVGPIQDDQYVFTHDAPVAQGIRLSGSTAESNTYHTAYKSGMSEWCANCHGAFHQSVGVLRHPSGMVMTDGIPAAYGMYNGTNQYQNGNPATSYLHDVPFEDAVNDTSYTGAPGAGSKVMCLTCHRPHASSAPDAGRWDFNVTLLSEDGVASGSYPIPNPYNYVEQRSLCNKCHVQDKYDEGSTP